MTTGISLVRENAESLQPPRTLWVPFPLGRPLGAPNDAEFQHRVIAATLELLDRPAGPVLDDFPEDAPQVDIEATACPVSFAQPVQNDSWQQRLTNEVSTLRPWHDLSLRRRKGRTLIGLSELTVADNLSKLGELLDTEQSLSHDLRWLKFAIEDAKAFYYEALTAQPGNYAQQELNRTFWQETQLGGALRRCHQILESDPSTRPVAKHCCPKTRNRGSVSE